ncbi:SpoIIIAH-like family protein [Hazenella coriacea]|uniref:Stage III sporulation protein AH n=1 Tax=Hazenella coriacea TaxID=1179467 RepID=A0A4R3L9L2_9BACL|nr:SpoIIIAH-like family protein [Hazenella coriacea]TCS96389.1 stage III sporulation protein AH [Hazenella coriacea]
MTMNKQTVWLVTMLTLMIVLSAYYIVTGPVQPADQVVKQTTDDKTGSMDVNIKTVGQSADPKTEPTTSSKANHDYFVAYQIQRDTLRGKLTEEYMKVMTNPEATKQESDEANKKINQLMKVDKAESVLEELIRKEGYNDAVVVTTESHVDVVVQSEKLSNNQAVKLISLAKQHLQVSPANVTVTFRP